MSTTSGAPFNFTLPEDGDLADFVGTFLRPQLVTINADAAHKTASQTLTNKTFGDAIKATQISTPSAPGAGYTLIYAKSDGLVYYRSGASGNEELLGGGGTTSFASQFILMGA